jgi:hypothetical protein
VGAGAVVLSLGPSGTALACGGLVAPNGTVNLLRTTTLAAYHRGIEHYVTSFQFAGTDATEVGSIVPLPGVPTRVIRGGDWTLQRLLLEVQPPQRLAFESAAAPLAANVEILLEKEIDALDITVLKGGAVGVGNWAREHGFFLPPDAPQVLDFYAQRSPIFLAARFNAERAAEQGVLQGQGTPVHIVIPTPNPWVPLRILALGSQPDAIVEADVFLLTDVEPATLPQAQEARPRNPDQLGLIREVSAPASDTLLDDLRSDKGMRWVPDDMWLTYIRVNTPASALTHDLAIDASGFGVPDPVAAGFRPPALVPPAESWLLPAALAAAAIAAMFVAAGAVERRRVNGRAA